MREKKLLLSSEYCTFQLVNKQPNIHSVASLELPELQPYRTLRRPLDHIQQGIFVAEGEKVVRRLLESNLSVVSLLMTPEWFGELSKTYSQLTNHNSPFTIYLADHVLVETIVGYNLHQGIMAVARVPENPTLKSLVNKISSPYFLVALDGLVNSENIGVIVRNCVAFGVHGIIVGEKSSSPYLRRAVRNSMGTVFKIPVLHVSNLAETLTTLHQTYSTTVLAAHPYEQFSIHQTNFLENVCIVLGHEGLGVSKDILDVCTNHVAIPMENETDSLNVASASAVFLYEAHKQRYEM
jgi:tRNA G18 (ribose-2'-O)-methylase SpoU